MVLVRSFQVFVVGLMVLLSGCMTTSQSVRLAAPADTQLAVVLQFPDRPEIAEVPESTTNRIATELMKRNLTARIVPQDSFKKPFETRRSTTQRVSDLSEGGYLLLVESEVRFYSLLSGKYRWNISGRITFVAPDGEQTTAPLELAAFLDFDHQREADAIAYVEVAIAERVGQVVDRLLAGRADITP